MSDEIITSKQNNKVKALVKLRDKKLLRAEIGQFLIEGFKELSEALKCDVKVIELYYCPEYFRDKNDFMKLVKAAEAQGSEIQEVSKDVYDKVSHREGPDGLLAIGETWILNFSDLKLRPNPLFMVVERMEKPGNLGNMIRSAEAAGVDALIVCDPVVDIFNPNVVRGSRGMVFNVQIVVTDNKSALEFFNEKGIQSVAMTPHASDLYWDLEMSGPTAILVGSEFQGLSDFWMKNPQVKLAKIPLNGRGDSLNAATAGTLAMFEALRQRHS